VPWEKHGLPTTLKARPVFDGNDVDHSRSKRFRFNSFIMIVCVGDAAWTTG
jgi:hypothetical protein